mgnify:CR=1 FL=1
MSSKKVLIVASWCPTCDTVKKMLSEKGVLDRFEVVDVSTPEGAAFAKSIGVMGVPDCAVVEQTDEGTKVRKCTDSEWREIGEGK